MTLPYPLIVVHLGPDLANSTGSLRIGHMARNAACSLQAHQRRSPLCQGNPRCSRDSKHGILKPFQVFLGLHP